MGNLTWNELADIYDKETGGKARTRALDDVFEWAEKRTDLFTVNEDGTISLKQKIAE